MARSDRPPEVICDAGPIIHLDELSALDLLADFSSVVVPNAVWLEIEQHRPEALKREQVVLQRTVVKVENDPVFAAMAQKFSLGSGEQAALQLTRQRPDAILLTDDAAARLVAEGLSLRAHGTVGILIRAVRRNQRTPQDALKLLQELPARSTLYLRAEFHAEIVQRFKDEYQL
jgi:predicted nucleic acid-binding protein